MHSQSQEFKSQFGSLHVSELFMSDTLSKIFFDIDVEFSRKEELIIQLKQKNEELDHRYHKLQNQIMSDNNRTMGNILLAAISAPSPESLGPVGATVLMRISEMKTVEEIRSYIKQISIKAIADKKSHDKPRTKRKNKVKS